MSPAVAVLCSLIGSFVGTGAALLIHARRMKQMPPGCYFRGWIDDSRKALTERPKQ